MWRILSVVCCVQSPPYAEQNDAAVGTKKHGSLVEQWYDTARFCGGWTIMPTVPTTSMIGCCLRWQSRLMVDERYGTIAAFERTSPPCGLTDTLRTPSCCSALPWRKIKFGHIRRSAALFLEGSSGTRVVHVVLCVSLVFLTDLFVPLVGRAVVSGRYSSRCFVRFYVFTFLRFCFL